MEVEILKNDIDWEIIKQCALATMGKEPKKQEITSEWKRKILISEHSPIRTGRFIIKVIDCKYFVLMELARHHIGIEKFIESSRDDRRTIEEVRNELKNAIIDINIQALFNIARVRLCQKAHKEMRELIELIKAEIAKIEPEIAKLMRPKCEWEGGQCREFYPCGKYSVHYFLDRRKDV